MDCKEIRNRIDEVPFEKGFQLENEVDTHLQTCPDCRKYYEDHKQVTQIISNLRDQDPVLHNPKEMKLQILNSIEHEKNTSGIKTFSLLIITRFLAAATVALLFTLGIEQYTVLRKVQHLEIQLGKIDQPFMNQEFKLYKSSIVDIKTFLSNGEHKLSFNNIPLLLQLKGFVGFNFTYKDLKRNMDKDQNIKKIINERINK